MIYNRYRIGWKDYNPIKWTYIEVMDEETMRRTVQELILQGKDVSVKVMKGLKL